MVKDSLFYAANFEPEVRRMAAAYESGQTDVALRFKAQALKITDEILSRREFPPAGREEWFCIRNLVLGYEKLDTYSRRALLSFGLPFSHKFVSQNK